FGVFSGDENGFSGNFDSRTPVKTDDTDLEAAINAKFASAGITVKYIDRVKSHVTPSDSPLVRKLLDVYELYTGEKGEPLAIGGSSYVHEIDGGVAFGCVFPGKNTLMHGANEHIDAEDLLTSAKMFARAIKEICE
ncbi:MAG: M20/M25/M40 family metallo-hydrolase, partial [Oscillospiraceae bacterium]|nr:M20/M25/M40 family metallo-hydrolase [Oscillospiraceae bacterium]